MTQDEIERLYAAGDTAGVEAALRQQASQAGDYWAVRSPGDAAAREFGTVPTTEDLGAAAELGLAGLRGTLFYKGYQQTRDMIGLPPADPNWKPANRWEELSKDIPMEYHQDLMETQSEEDYLRLRARVSEKITDQRRFASNGPSGMAAMIGGSLFDVDLLLAPLSDGAYTAAKIARTVKSARAARMIGTALETGVVSGGVTLAYEGIDDGSLDWTGVASSTMMGFVMGGAAGSIISPPTARLWTDGAQKMRDDFHARMADDLDLGEYRESIPSTADYKQYLAQATKAKNAEPDSVGAAATPGGARPSYSAALVNERHQAWVDLAADELAQRYGTKARAPYRGLDEALKKIEGYLGDVGLGSDWAKFANSDSKIAQWIASRFLESPTGKGGRSGTAAIDREMFQRRILQGMPEYQASYARWAQGQNATLVDIHWKQDLAEQFGKEVHLEMNYRRLHDTESPNAHADVKKAADALEKQAKEAYDILKASGTDFDAKYKRGYSPLRWNGLAMRNAVASGKATKNDIIELIANGYAPALGLPMNEVRVFARALYTRAVSKADDFDTSLQNLLTADGRAFLRERLVDNGIAAKRADEIVESLSGPLEERGKAGFAKNRTEIDLSVNHNGLNLIDFTDNNLSRNWTLYARQASGNAALARAGIKNKAERGEIMDALTAEQVALNEAPLDRQFMEDVFSYFDAGPVSGGVNPNVSRLKKLTNLSLLNKLGIAQAAETGVTIAAVGWENFLAHAPAVRRFIKNGQAGNTDALLDEIGAWTGRIWDEEKLINPEIDFNVDKMNTDDLGKFMQGLDRFLAKGQRLQGHLSLFYTIRSGQTRAAAAGIVDKLFKLLKAEAGYGVHLKHAMPGQAFKTRGHRGTGGGGTATFARSVFQDAEYWAPDPEIAKAFGATVQRGDIDIANPAVVRTDADLNNLMASHGLDSAWGKADPLAVQLNKDIAKADDAAVALAKKASAEGKGLAETMKIRADHFKAEKDRLTKEWEDNRFSVLDQLADALRSAGNDGLVVSFGVDTAAKAKARVGKPSAGTETLEALFSHDQVVMLSKGKAKPASAPTGDVGAHGRRFDDIGFSPDMREQLAKMIEDGTIEFTPQGFIDRLNMDKWDPMLAHEFSGAITRFVHQVIQKDLIGESNVWMSKDMGALFTHLIQFPLLAMQKQAIRNTRLLDATSKATLLYGLTTAGLAYAAGQMIEGRTDKLDPISIAKGALSYSNMTGFLPMMWDPVATMFGVDDWRINRYGQHSELGLPTVDWVNKAIRVPGAIMSAVDGGIDKGDKSALKALPFANMYGSALVFNALEEGR